MSSCPICLESISSTKASPDVCDHVFCLECLTKWSKLESFCPVDRMRFRKIINLDTGTSHQVKRRGKKRKARALYDVSVFCEVCKSEEREAILLLCDSCDLAYHCDCLSPPLSAVPSGRWFCPVCNSIDRRLEQDIELSKKPRGESHQSFIQTSNCSISTQSSSVAVKSSDEKFDDRSPRQRNLNRKGTNSRMVQCISSPSTSSSDQVNAVKISREDYQIICAHSKSLFLAPGFAVSPTRRRIKDNARLLPNVSLKVCTSRCDTNEHSKLNSEGNLSIFALLERKESELDCKNKESHETSRSTKTSNIIYKSTVSRPSGNRSDISKSNEPSSNLSTSCGYSYKDKTCSRGQLSDVSVLETVSKSETAKQKLESFQKDLRDSDDSSDCEIIFDGSNCITVSDKTNLKEVEYLPKVTAACQSAQNSKGTCENRLTVPDSRPFFPSNTCEGDGHLTETDHVSETEDEHDSSHLLDDFEIRSSQYAAKAKMNLPRELKQIEEEKWKLWTPHKRAKASRGTSSSDQPDVPETKKQGFENVSSNSKQVFNIIDYTKKVKNGKHLPSSSEILNKYKAFVTRNAEKFNSKPKIESVYDLNVFQGPFSQKSCVHGGTKIKFMQFKPPKVHKEDSSSTQVLKTYPTILQRDFQDLCVREDGSLFINWSMKCS